MNRLITRDSKARNAWGLSKLNCQACGFPFNPPAWGRWREVHHIIGNVGRSDEPTNWLALCARCHKLAEGQQVRVDGELLPVLTLGMCLTIKAHADSEEWDGNRLATLYGSNLPRFDDLPEFFLTELRRNFSK